MRAARFVGAGPVASAPGRRCHRVARRPGRARHAACRAARGQGMRPGGAVPTPSRGSYDGLYGVSAVGSTGARAVGRHVNAGSADRALVEN